MWDQIPLELFLNFGLYLCPLSIIYRSFSSWSLSTQEISPNSPTLLDSSCEKNYNISLFGIKNTYLCLCQSNNFLQVKLLSVLKNRICRKFSLVLGNSHQDTLWSSVSNFPKHLKTTQLSDNPLVNDI